MNAAAITAAIVGFKLAGPFGALAGATFANHYGDDIPIPIPKPYPYP
jgi:hypothetical protein